MTPEENEINIQFIKDIHAAIEKAKSLPTTVLIGNLEGAKFFLLCGGKV